MKDEMNEREYLAMSKEIDEFVRANQKTLREQYGEDYLAFSGEDLLAHGKDRFGLAGEVRKKFPDRIVYVTNINQAINQREVKIRSPRLR